MSHHAAIDIGTNSFHLLVADVNDDGSFEVLTTEKAMVRLGDGPGDIREISAAASDRGVAALHRFRAIADSFDADIQAVATSAVREADNGPAFVDRVANEAGIAIDVISGVEEARLIHLGVLQALPIFDQQVLVVDIGGGSTETVIGRSGKVLAARSVKLGHLRLTNRFFPEGHVTQESIDECRAYVRAYLTPMLTAMRPLGYQIAVGCSGTVTALGDLIRMGSHGATAAPGLDTVVDRPSLQQALDELGRWETAADRASNIEGLAERRADVIVAGAILLDEIMAGFDVERMLTSPYALREGVLLDRTHGIEGGATRLADLRRESLLAMADAFEEDRSHVQHSTDLSVRLFDELAPLHGYGNHERDLLEAGGLLHNVGLFVSHAGHHHHSYYIIRNSDRLMGYTQREVDLIALIARYHRRSGPKQRHEPFMALTESDRNRVRWLAAILRIGIALDRTRNTVIEDVEVEFDDARIEVRTQVSGAADASVEIFQADARSRLLAETAGREVVIR